MKDYRKKPVVIQAIQFTNSPENVNQLMSFMGDSFKEIDNSNVDRPIIRLKTLESEGETQVAALNDFIVKGIKGEFYPVKPDIFEESFESADTTKVVTEDMQLLAETVFPSNLPTIYVHDKEDGYGGAHKYTAINSKGFEHGEAQYDTHGRGSAQTLQFVKKADDGIITPGLQSEQLAIILMDRAKKLDARFPSEFNKKQIAGLQMFLDACKERVEDRMNRGVMGQLAK